MRVKRFLSVILAMGLLLPTVNVNAAERDATTESRSVMTEDANLKNLDGYMGTLKEEDFNLSIPSKPVNIQTAAEVAADKYEPNGNMETATRGLKGQLVSANIHSDTDVDWYQFEVTSDDVANQVQYSFVLTNISQLCDYDMYLSNSNYQAVANLQEGPTSEQMIVTFNAAGTYYVVIQTASGHSDYNYKLYFGPTYVNGSTNWRSTGLTFDFPNKQAGTDGYVSSTSGWQNYDLTNDASIPELSILTQFQMDSNHTGTWGGLYKYLKSQNGAQYEQLGLINVMNVPENTYYVKQKWSITGAVNYATALKWKPNVLIKYSYPVIIENMGYLS